MKTLPLTLAIATTLLSWQAVAENVIRTKAPIAKTAFVAEPSPVDPEPEPELPPEPIARASCLEILQSGDGTRNGVYEITLRGSKQNVYCNMTESGGGWTMVVAQFETDPVANWNEGIQGDYDPSLTGRRSFTLSTAQIPQHTQVGFGQDLQPTSTDYITTQYSTGNLSSSGRGLRTGVNFQMHRNTDYYYSFHHVTGAKTSASLTWANTLTFDATQNYQFAWAFSPRRELRQERGYSMNGAKLYEINDTRAWTVWVR